MPIFVDDARLDFRYRGHRVVMSHLFSIPLDVGALHAFAAKVKLLRNWFQPTSFPHYDVTEPRRQRAISAGAIPVDIRAGARLRLNEKRRLKNEKKAETI